MSPEEAVRQRIIDVSTSAGTRVYMLRMPQGVTLPAIVVQLVDDIERPHLRGGNRQGEARVQVDCYVTERGGYTALLALADAVDGDDAGSALNGWKGTIGAMKVEHIARITRAPSFESEELAVIRLRLDYRVVYRDAAGT